MASWRGRATARMPAGASSVPRRKHTESCTSRRSPSRCRPSTSPSQRPWFSRARGRSRRRVDPWSQPEHLVEVTPDDGALGPAEELLHRAVPRADHPGVVGGDDGVGHGGDRPRLGRLLPPGCRVQHVVPHARRARAVRGDPELPNRHLCSEDERRRPTSGSAARIAAHDEAPSGAQVVAGQGPLVVAHPPATAAGAAWSARTPSWPGSAARSVHLVGIGVEVEQQRRQDVGSVAKWTYFQRSSRTTFRQHCSIGDAEQVLGDVQPRVAEVPLPVALGAPVRRAPCAVVQERLSEPDRRTASGTSTPIHARIVGMHVDVLGEAVDHRAPGRRRLGARVARRSGARGSSRPSSRASRSASGRPSGRRGRR